jgi:hypothetical protein
MGKSQFLQSKDKDKGFVQFKVQNSDSDSNDFSSESLSSLSDKKGSKASSLMLLGGSIGSPLRRG